jgi:hypothetical protein
VGRIKIAVSKMTNEGLIAVIGAVTGVASLIWNISKYLLEKPKIRLDAIVGTDQYAPKSQGHRSLILRVFNIGRRPTVIIRWSARKNFGQGLHDINVPNNGFPVSLLIGESHTILEEDLSILSPELEQIYVLDIEGKEWMLQKKSLKPLIADAQRIKQRFGPKGSE